MSKINLKLKNFQKVIALLERTLAEFKAEPNREVFQFALVHAYEMSFEMAWKMLKEVESLKGVEVQSPRDVIKEAYNLKLITDDKLWLKMLDDRNVSTHQYDEDKVMPIMDDIVNEYINELISLGQFLQDEISKE